MKLVPTKKKWSVLERLWSLKARPSPVCYLTLSHLQHKAFACQKEEKKKHNEIPIRSEKKNHSMKQQNNTIKKKQTICFFPNSRLDCTVYVICRFISVFKRDLITSIIIKIRHPEQKRERESCKYENNFMI